MRSLLIGVTIIGVASPAWAQMCPLVDDPVIGWNYDCSAAYKMTGRSYAPPSATAGGSLASAEATCGGNQYCINEQKAIWDGGTGGQTTGTDAATAGLGMAAAVAAAFGQNAAAAVFGFAAAAVGPMSDAANSGAIGDAAAASAAEGGGF